MKSACANPSGKHCKFADGALATLHVAGASRIVTSNSIAGETALVDISAGVTAALAEVCGNAWP